jgi:hypothetical protein
MDDSQFDQLARALGAVRTRRTALAAAGGVLTAPVLASIGVSGKRKKRKKCAKKCKDGCCTSKFGKCIKPTQQNTSQCGAGGGICQNSCPCSASLPCPAGQCCNGAGTCGECKVFVTERLAAQGALGGLTGADAVCQSRATAAGLPGTYMAWLSDSSSSPITRFAKATVPYTLPGGETVATSWADLTSGNALRHAINQTESGDEISGTSLGAFMVWTNTTQNGSVGGTDPSGHCFNWTSTLAGATGNIGDARSATKWTLNGFQQCPVDSRLYCFQQR